jgi:hypothetical protein
MFGDADEASAAVWTIMGTLLICIIGACYILPVPLLLVRFAVIVWGKHKD